MAGAGVGEELLAREIKKKEDRVLDGLRMES